MTSTASNTKKPNKQEMLQTMIFTSQSTTTNVTKDEKTYISADEDELSDEDENGQQVLILHHSNGTKVFLLPVYCIQGWNGQVLEVPSDILRRDWVENIQSRPAFCHPTIQQYITYVSHEELYMNNQFIIRANMMHHLSRGPVPQRSTSFQL
jgi:hypothetical protein